MKNTLHVIFFAGIALFPVVCDTAKAVSSVRIVAVYCDHMTDPLAVETSAPKLRWVLDSKERGARQTAYQIIVSRNPHSLAKNIGDLWDTGKVPGDDNTGVRYSGAALTSADRCWWKVRVWDGHNRVSAWSKPAKWEVGFLSAADWHGKWIAQSAAEDAAPLFRREFKLNGKVQQARLRIYGLGWYEAFLNGNKVGDHVLAPANSHYDLVNLYDTYDVTSLLTEGSNAIGVMLGGGYNAGYSQWGWKWEKSKRFILQLWIEMTDGSIQEIVSDKNWRTASGPITYCDIYNGERYDSRLQRPGWCNSGYDDKTWSPAQPTDAPGGRLLPSTMPPVRMKQTLQPIAITKINESTYVVDMGQNFAGWVRMSVAGARGDSVVLRYSELVDANGRLDPWSNRKARATDVYIFKGTGTEVYEPRFTYHGFRYVEVSGLRQPLTRKMIQGRVVHADLQHTGSFVCSNRLLNRVVENFRWSMLSNFMSIPTDCAARDERTPCAMDSRVVEEGAMYLFPMYRYYAKWLRDNAGGTGNPDWSGDFVLLAQRLYDWYGDASVLEEHLPSMKNYVDLLRTRVVDLIYKDGFGDWCAPNVGTWESYFSNVAPVNTALFQQCAAAVAAAAGVLQDSTAMLRYHDLADSVRHAYNQTFFHENLNTYGNGTQTEDILPLAFSFVAKDKERQVADHLVHTILKDKQGHLDTGITGTRYIGDVLCDAGYANIAFQVLTQRTYPGYGHQIDSGATTTWEQWHAKGGMNSHNHAMFSGPMATLFSRFGGIRPMAPGFRRLLIKPALTDSLTWVRTSIETVRGAVSVQWRREFDQLHLDVHIPPGAEAEIHLPSLLAPEVLESRVPAGKAPHVLYSGRCDAAEVFLMGSGDFHFTGKMKAKS